MSHRSDQKTPSAEATTNRNKLAGTNKHASQQTRGHKANRVEGESVPVKKGKSVQVGIDCYINIKRKCSPTKTAVNSKTFQPGTPSVKKTAALNGNRFALLINDSNDVAKEATTVVSL
nr:uncharacterized protein LOC118680031 [Bactrocera oleae]